MTLVVRLDGNFEIVQCHGIIALSTTGVLGTIQGAAGDNSIPGGPSGSIDSRRYLPESKNAFKPGRAANPAIHLRLCGGSGDLVQRWPVPVIYNYPDDRVAYHLTSMDGVHNWTDRGVAYDPRQAQKLFTYVGDTTVNKWYKIERPSVVMDNGHVTYFTFAVADVDKNDQIPANSNHGSKVVVVPFDGASFEADTAVGGSTSAGGSSSIGGTSATGGSRVSGGSSNTEGTKATGGSNSKGGANSSTGGLTSIGGAEATGGSRPTVVNTGGTTSVAVPSGGHASTGSAAGATGGAVAMSLVANWVPAAPCRQGDRSFKWHDGNGHGT